MKPRIVIRAIGKAHEAWHREAIMEYQKRLGSLATLEIFEIAEGHQGSSKPNVEKTKSTEGDALLRGLAEDAVIIALNEHGRSFSSSQFARQLMEWNAGDRPLIFLIGGSWGLSENVLQRARIHLSLGPMTLPHLLARILLLEQLYRARMIQLGRTYHK